MSTTISLTPALPIPEFLNGEVRSKLAYADEAIRSVWVAADGSSITLELRLVVEETARTLLEEKVQRIVTSMVQGALKPKVKVLEDRLDKKVPFTEDPHVELTKRGEIFQEDIGIFTLGPLITSLIGIFEERFLALASTFDAVPYRFPTLLPARFLDRIAYYRAFPHSLNFVAHLREDLDTIETFAAKACCDAHGLVSPPESFAQVKAVLSPAICFHLYYSLADKTLLKDKLIATAVGNCFRYESSNLVSLERLWNFTMREVIFVGTKDFVLASREIAQRRMQAVLEEFGLAYRVESANDPFFIGEFRQQAAFQNAFQLKYEIRARLPFKDSTLAVGSYNYHQDFFGRNLNITLSDGRAAHTGCVAFGLERLAYAFLAQYGLDQKLWPVTVRSALKN